MEIDLQYIKTDSLRKLIIRNREAHKPLGGIRVAHIDVDAADKATLQQLGNIQGEILSLFGRQDEVTEMITLRLTEVQKAAGGIYRLL